MKKVFVFILLIVVLCLLAVFILLKNNKNIPNNGQQPTLMPSKNCFVGGCSRQICSGRNDIISTCEYREEYICYKTAICEKQSNGQCGWTKTNELLKCLESKGDI